MKGLPEKGPPASGMCVIHEMRDGSFRYAGYAFTIMTLTAGDPYFLAGARATNGSAEIHASIMASLWALQSGFRSFRYCFDATYAERAAAAESNIHANHDMVHLAIALRKLLCTTADRVESMHTPAHKGHP